MNIFIALFAWLKKLIIAFHLSKGGGFFVTLLIYLSSIFAPVYLNIAFITLLVIADVIFGIMASVKKGEPLTSKRLKEGLIDKMAMYGILLMCFLGFDYIFQSIFIFTSFYFVGFITSIIGFYETISITEKMLVLQPNLGVFSRILKWLKKTDKKLEDKIDKKIDDI